MITDVIDDRQVRLSLGFSKAATELLYPQDPRLSRPEHHHRV